MTKRFHNSIRTLAFATALLQLLTLPATCVLHVGCTHDHLCAGRTDHSSAQPGSSDTASCASVIASHCSCGHHHAPARDPDEAETPAPSGPGQTPSGPTPSGPAHSAPSHSHGHHHDSDSCRICQSAFALATSTVLPVRLPAPACVAAVEERRPAAPQTPPCFRWSGRGPPIV